MIDVMLKGVISVGCAFLGISRKDLETDPTW